MCIWIYHMINFFYFFYSFTVLILTQVKMKWFAEDFPFKRPKIIIQTAGVVLSSIDFDKKKIIWLTMCVCKWIYHIIKFFFIFFSLLSSLYPHKWKRHDLWKIFPSKGLKSYFWQGDFFYLLLSKIYSFTALEFLQECS